MEKYSEVKGGTSSDTDLGEMDDFSAKEDIVTKASVQPIDVEVNDYIIEMEVEDHPQQDRDTKELKDHGVHIRHQSSMVSKTWFHLF